MINLELYKIFVLVAKEKNITKASEILHISQPAVTKHIKNLEDELQVRLFNRTNHGIELTKEGKAIYDEIKESVYILESIYNKYSKTKTINLGIHATMLNKLFSKKLIEYYETHENIKIDITNRDILEMLSKLEVQQLDIIISKKTEEYKKEKIEFISLGILHDILVVNNSFKFSKLTIDEIKKEILYMPRKTSVTTTNFFNSLNCNEKDFKNIKNISYNTMIEIIKNTNGIGLVTKEYVEKELERKEIIELKPTFKIKPIEYGVYVNKDNKFKELKDLIKLIEKDMLV